MEAHHLRVKNIGPVREFECVLQPGVNVARGANGAGKSHLLAALSRAFGAKDAEFSVTDGQRRGELVLDGATLLTVGKVNRQTGAAEVSLASISPLAVLIEPGLQDKEAAERARIGALLQMLDLDVTAETIDALVGGSESALAYLDQTEGLDSLRSLTIVDAADRIRRRLHELKRQHLDSVQRAEGEMLALTPVRPLIESHISSMVAAKKHETAIRQHDRLFGEHAQRVEREKERAEIAATLGSRPDIEAAKQALTEAEQKNRAIEVQIQALETQLHELQLKHATSTVELDTAQGMLTKVGRDANDWDRRRAILDSEITGASAEDVAAAEAAVAEAAAALEAARQTEEYQRKALGFQNAQRAADAAKQSAEEAEALALAVNGHLGEIVQRAGDLPLTVEDGQLCFVHSDGHTELFSRLSTGQRTDIACKLQARSLSGTACLVALPGDIWESLDEVNQADVAAAFERAGLLVLTEEPDTGELRVESFQETQ